MKAEEIFTEENVNELKKIAKYIWDISDSCIHANYETPEDLDELSGEDLLEQTSSFFSFELIGMCGCGCMLSTVEKIVDYLEIIKQWSVDVNNSKDLMHDITPSEHRHKSMKEKFGVESESDDPLVQLLAYVVDHAGLSDHGSSINGCWITERGEMCLFVYKLLLAKESTDEE